MDALIKQAIEALNTPTERTCHVEHLEQFDGMQPAMKCLSCGFETTESNAKYCPHCGAKVVDDE